MKCSVKGCQGEYEPRAITHAVRRNGHVAVLEPRINDWPQI
jgi:hypothetical protein